MMRESESESRKTGQRKKEKKKNKRDFLKFFQRSFLQGPASPWREKRALFDPGALSEGKRKGEKINRATLA